MAWPESNRPAPEPGPSWPDGSARTVTAISPGSSPASMRSWQSPRADRGSDLGEVLEALPGHVAAGEIGGLGALDRQVGPAAQRPERFGQELVRLQRVQRRGEGVRQPVRAPG